MNPLQKRLYLTSIEAMLTLVAVIISQLYRLQKEGEILKEAIINEDQLELFDDTS